MFKRVALYGAGVIVLLALTLLLVLVWQGRKKPDTSGQYVALGSSFAAGLGLGPRMPGSPLVCMRSTHGYPHLLAAMTGLSLVDMSCSGSTTDHILHGGQVFLGPQLDAIGPETRLVTITSGGNDVGYIGDLTLASGRGGMIGKLLWKGPKPVAERDFGKVTENVVRIVQEIRRRAPRAVVVVVSYPAVLPEQGSCAALGIDAAMADTGRQIAARLHDATQAAARRAGAVFVDMAAAGAGHDACAPEPWVNGAAPASGAPFHPSQAGARATAAEVFKAIAGKFVAG
ncbi:MAG: SGNH/GDSL hydrolase family protein [Sphingomonadales bacterium]|nr:SGNH/GDSL hydrolase family protein [Sphingomonadales bacterium]